MAVPESFKKLGKLKTDFPLHTIFVIQAATRGTGGEGAVPADTKILFAIGGKILIEFFSGSNRTGAQERLSICISFKFVSNSQSTSYGPNQAPFQLLILIRTR